MAKPWRKRTLQLAHWTGSGQLAVVAQDGDWVGCRVLDPESLIAVLASATADGVLWIRKRDLIECPENLETLI